MRTNNFKDGVVADCRRARSLRPLLFAAAIAVAGALVLPKLVFAQDPSETSFVLNTFSFLVWGALVMWMCAGFTMLESGSVRSKNASMICLKNIGLYSIAGLSYYVVGYSLMYTDVGSFIGSIGTAFFSPSDQELIAVTETSPPFEQLGLGSHSSTSDWFFQMVFVATTASIVSGSLAERVKLGPFLVFCVGLTALIYPIVGAWTWGEGWLAAGSLGFAGFSDFAGSTIVHSTGGWAALAGIMMVGPRWGKFRKDGSIKSTPPSNIPAVTLGVFILWLGWFGFNGGSVLSMSGAGDAVTMSNVIMNTNLAAGAGVITALAVSRPVLGRLDLFSGLNGALAGLVAITAGPDAVAGHMAVAIGAMGALLATVSTKLLERFRLDDVVGAVPVHLVAGIWGTLAVALPASIGGAGGSLPGQLVGVLAVGAFVFPVSLLAWRVLDAIWGIRVSREVEEVGQDAAELGIDAYPEFILNVDNDYSDYRDA